MKLGILPDPKSDRLPDGPQQSVLAVFRIRFRSGGDPILRIEGAVQLTVPSFSATRGEDEAGAEAVCNPDGGVCRGCATPTAEAAGSAPGAVASQRHFRRPVEHPFTLEERGRVTLLVGGLTAFHDSLIVAVLEGFGHRASRIAVPTKADFQSGREFGNNGQCNPTYFTVGALVNHLKALRDRDGVPVERILSDHVFVTAGSCGPCRFGMYEAEYRLALRNAGFDGFRVLVLAQAGEAGEGRITEGLGLDTHMVASLANATFMSDLLVEIAHQIRPYELVPGATDRAMARCVAICADSLRESARAGLAGLARRLGPGKWILGTWSEWRGKHHHAALERCRQLLDREVEVDFLRPKPIAKITGEFWAQTTEGDGNFHMFRFLEQEGAEVLAEPVATWIDYSFAFARRNLHDRWVLCKGLKDRFRLALSRASLALVHRLVKGMFERHRCALGGTAHSLASQPELQRMGHPFYNSRCGGGEGHLEVAKNIYYSSKGLAHMVLSLKPFGCMPSTQSDGAQAAVLAHYPDMIFLPIETSGEGDVNAHSRVQMALGEAKGRAKAEFRNALERSGYELSALRAAVAARRDLRSPMRPLSHAGSATGRAARFALEVAGIINASGLRPGFRSPEEGGPPWDASQMRP